MNSKFLCILYSGVVAAFGCGDSSGLHGGLNILYGDHAADTVGSVVKPAFTVQLVDGDLSPMAGQTIYFGSDGVLIAPVDDPSFQTNRFPVTTDANGIAAAYVEFTQSAGTGKVVATAPSGQYVTGHYTVLPGAPRYVRADPPDTTLFVGGTEMLRPYLTDAYGNRRADTVMYQYASLSGALSITGAGKATGTAIGRGMMAITALGFTDTAWTSVVPKGRILSQYRGIFNYSGGSITSVNLDGSVLDTIPGSDPGGYSIDWAPGDTTVALTTGSPHQLYLMNVSGSLHRVLTNALMRAEWHPRFSADGSQIVFAGVDSISNCVGVWRIHTDGTALAQVVADTTDCGPFIYVDDPTPDFWPSLSPDGTELVYADHTLRLKKLTTGADTSLGVFGDAPDWSPTGEWIAYDSAGTLKMIRPDGTGDQSLVVRPYGTPLSLPATTWSPDGQWLIYRGYDRLVLLQISTGLQLPLPFTIGWADPVWQR